MTRYYVDATKASRDWYIVDRQTGERKGPFSPSEAAARVRDLNQGRKPIVGDGGTKG